jgi:cysteine-rich repeat protein
VTVFAADDVTVLATPTVAVPSGSRAFFGWAEAGGIGRVELRDQSHAWSPVIDDLEFSFCGNGTVDALFGEECEDGNIVDGDGCDHNCTFTACGNGIVAGTASAEQCDDGNTAGGDCCSGTCQFEASGSACASDGLPCSTDVCDGGGTCTHDASPSGTVCRSSAGVCDPAEICNGIAKTCPPPSFASGSVCRPAVDVCDAPESCSGSGPDCPPDVYRTGTCRTAAGACDVAESCDGSSTACPADAKSMAACRVAAGSCDFTEFCDGLSNDCPANVTAADGTACDDGDTCTLVDTCQSGACTGADRVDCDDGNGCTADTCDSLGNCINDDSPNAGCLTAAKSLVRISQSSDGSRDKLLWKWGRGDAFAQADLGDPTSSARYALCVYAGTASALIADAALPPGPSWSARGTKGYRFKGTSPDGLSLAILQGGAIGKSRALVRGRGVALPHPTLPLTYPVIVQLKREGSPFCLESPFTLANETRNDTTQFKAK